MSQILALPDLHELKEVALEFHLAEGRTTTVSVSARGVVVKGTYPDSGPAWELYKHSMGFAQAYGLTTQNRFTGEHSS